MKLVLLTSLITLSVNLPICAQGFSSSEAKMNPFIRTFVASYTDFIFDIQAAGIATIPAASWSDQGVLVIDYAYHSEGEDRKGECS